MLGLARRRTEGLAWDVAFLVADAEALPFREHSFDTVVSSLALCTYVDPLAALLEFSRVCRPSGRILLLEHGRSHRP
jgi:ubiquinone/menaquinone biosynthesis C-methylase UbiE